ncbi:MAG TPA: ComF family protein [Thermohalobaculum sp.]|nr:ComF family protein [Thermohalobaculum sp.]
MPMRAARAGPSAPRAFPGRLAAGLGGAILGIVYPPVCAGCGAETGTPETLCSACWGDLHLHAGPGCRACGRDVAGLAPGEGFVCDDCVRRPPPWTAGAAVFAYEGTGRRLVLALKHGDRLDSVPMLARWMRRAGAPLVAEAELIVPVPLHWTRLVRRRFNQSAELARALARLADKRPGLRPDVLRRIRRTPSQEGRSREERAANVAGALVVPRARAGAVDGRRVLLVDDVMTTGATLDAAARALKAAGAARVDVLVLALVGGSLRSYLDAPPADGTTDEARET